MEVPNGSLSLENILPKQMCILKRGRIEAKAKGEQ